MSANPLFGLAQRLEHAADLSVEAETAMVTAAAELVKTSIAAAVQEDVRNGRVAGAKVGARYDVKVYTGHPVALVKEDGPLHLESNPTQPHIIIPKDTVVGRFRGREARLSAYWGSAGGAAHPLRTPYGPRWRVNHPGTRGKRTWQKGVERAEAIMPQAVRSGAATFFRGLFR